MIEVGPLQISEITLARDLHQWGQHKVAEALFQQAATHAEQVLGPDDPALASILDAYSDFLVTRSGKQRQIPRRTLKSDPGASQAGIDPNCPLATARVSPDRRLSDLMSSSS